MEKDNPRCFRMTLAIQTLSYTFRVCFWVQGFLMEVEGMHQVSGQGWGPEMRYGVWGFRSSTALGQQLGSST